MRAEISGVVPGSIGEELGVKKGDLLRTINGIAPADLLDYRYLSADEFIELEIEKPHQERVIFEIEKDEDEDLGIIFDQDTFDGIKRCKNKCIFCFVDQMPPDLRNTLYLKDDDYRLSLLYGNFITLTNISTREISRIKDMHISPLYISVHSTNPALRQKMLGHSQAGQIVSYLRDLAQAGIEMHTQIVLCPGVNDGEDLYETVHQLSAFWPHVQSVAVVPVGVTKFQKNPLIRPFTGPEAQHVVETVSQWQNNFQKHLKTNFVYLADEFYLLAQREIPPYDHYEGFPQIENGVGLVRSFWTSFRQASALLPKSLDQTRKITFVTGRSAQPVLGPIVKRLNQIDQLEVDLISLTNHFFGPSVTVAGLLTGHDLMVGLRDWRRQYKQDDCPEIFVSSVLLKFGEDLFLDNMTVDQVEKALKIMIHAVDPVGESLIHEVMHQGGKNQI
ncbi:DUF512 domain-containing protein [Candidatus Formimonas warabiya]|uniref:DUF512 domain-containing protein n=1 Tax=Formimonas warabiya TaxID=1761012 RepID=A0A3G1KNW1_FORW1|nr:DUF512 domain-containing protein [Candidatus Formimonas warabiya]ATW24110.1 hypothetical protein DCMF_04335 [Candidatus Formimonas warabiya]